VGVKVQKLSSTKTQLPYEYYSLPFCKPAEVVNSVENLGEVCGPSRCGPRHSALTPHGVRTTQVLRGDRIENSVYVVRPAALPLPDTFLLP
jgi:hypothetical protein